MATNPVRFRGSTGAALAARLEVPEGAPPRAWAIFAHCFTCSKNLRSAVGITRALAEEGFGVLRFDFTGLGESEGDFADTGFSSNVEDLLAAARFLADGYGEPRLLVGHSLGGAAVLHAAARLSSVRAVSTVGAPAEPAHVLRHIAASVEEIRRSGFAEVVIGGRPFRVGRRFLDDLQAPTMDAVVSRLSAALLIFHSPTDEVVGIENAARLFRMARHPKSFISLAGADHLLTRAEDARYVGRVLAAWADRYVP